MTTPAFDIRPNFQMHTPAQDTLRLTLARVFALIALYAIPVSPAIVNIAATAFVLFALLSPEVRHNWKQLFTDRVMLATLLLIAMFGISLVYTSADRIHALEYLGKYRKLIYLPLLLLTFKGCKTRAWTQAALTGFVAVLTVTLFLSCTNYFGLTSVGQWHDQNEVMRAWVFKDHISAGLMNALLFLLALRFADRATRRLTKVAFYCLALISIVNVLLMLQGRTGQVVAILYMIGYVIQRIARMNHAKPHTRWTAGIVMAAICGALVFFTLHSRDSRLVNTPEEIEQTEHANILTSGGVRLIFIQRSLKLIGERPIFGHGAASLQAEFNAFAHDQSGALATTSDNPHNEYLLITVQLGLVGLALLINWLVQIGYAAWSLAEPARTVVWGYLIAFVLGCFANSLLLNFTEGNLFIFLVGIFLYQPNEQTPKGMNRADQVTASQTL
jgi:O-antigen ligase